MLRIETSERGIVIHVPTVMIPTFKLLARTTIDRVPDMIKTLCPHGDEIPCEEDLILLLDEIVMDYSIATHGYDVQYKVYFIPHAKVG